MIILVLWAASALVGLAIGIRFFRVLAVALALPLIAFFSAAVLRFHGFELVPLLLISVGSLTALQAFYLLGASVRYLTDDERAPRDQQRSTRPESTASNAVSFQRIERPRPRSDAPGSS